MVSLDITFLVSDAPLVTFLSTCVGLVTVTFRVEILVNFHGVLHVIILVAFLGYGAFLFVVCS